MYPYNKRPRTTSSDTDEDERDQHSYSNYTVRKRKLALDDDEGVIKKKPPTYSDFSMKVMVLKPFIHL